MTDSHPIKTESSTPAENQTTDPPISRLKFPLAFWWVGLGLGWAVDLLFWKKRFGISYAIFVVLILAGSLFLAKREKKRIPAVNFVLIAAILATTALAVFRMEPVTRFVNVVASLMLILLLNATFLDGYWLFFRIKDVFLRFLELLFVSATSRAAQLFAVFQKKGNPDAENDTKHRWKASIIPVLRGILLAFPILLVFTALLASADPIFNDYIRSFLNIFKIENLSEYIFRLFYILVLAYIFTGLLLHGIQETGNKARPDPRKPWMSPFLGWTETAIILYAVDLLFLGFVSIQFRYFFGGEANINAAGYTYAEYARRGATELIMVAILALMLYLTLETISRRQKHKPAFSFGSVALLGLVLVILVSSYQRLLLYEEAYGFTEIRTRTHIFIFWLAGLLIATAVLEILQHSERFFPALLTACLGFSLTLGLINMEGFIVQKNVQRTYLSQELDVNYINRMTSDAVPQLIRSYDLPGLDTKTKDRLGAELACRNYKFSKQEVMPWISYNPSEATARRLLAEQTDLMEKYIIIDNSNPFFSFVKFDWGTYSCYADRWLD